MKDFFGKHKATIQSFNFIDFARVNNKYFWNC